MKIENVKHPDNLTVTIENPKTEPKIEPTSPQAPENYKIRLIFIAFFIFWFFIVYFIVPTVMPFYLSTAFNISSTLIGTAISIATLFLSISSFSYRFLRLKFSFVTIEGLSYIILGIGFTVIGFANSYGIVIIGFLLSGTGTGLTMPNCVSWAVAITPTKSRGITVGFISTFLFLGQFLSPVISSLIISQVGTKKACIFLGATVWIIGLILVLTRFIIFIKDKILTKK